MRCNVCGEEIPTGEPFTTERRRQIVRGRIGEPSPLPSGHTSGPITFQHATCSQPDGPAVVGSVAEAHAVAKAAYFAAVETIKTERDALRVVAEAARAFVPVCDEEVYTDDGRGRSCQEIVTHHSRMNGHKIGYLCDAHAADASRAAVKAASKGHTYAVTRDAPVPIETEPRVRALADALAKVPKVPT